MGEITDRNSLGDNEDEAKKSYKVWYGDAKLSQYLLLFALIAVILAVIASVRGEEFLPTIKEAFRLILAGF